MPNELYDESLCLRNKDGRLPRNCRWRTILNLGAAEHTRPTL